MTARTTRGRWAALGLTALTLPLVACGALGADNGACGPITREALDPAFLVHVVGDAADVTYASDPPTSGPHQPAPAAAGRIEEPLARPVQVGVLERGDILIQHQLVLETDELDELDGLAGEGVVVAPNPDLADRVVATAWTAKRVCTAVDVVALTEFITARANQGPDG